MGSFSRLQKLSAAAFGIVGGGIIYYRLTSKEKNLSASNSWTTNYTPSTKWDYNWDHRCPSSIVKPQKNASPEEQNRYNVDIEKSQTKAVRHLFLIRHGQYHLDGLTDAQRSLTELGRKQAELTGQRLARLGIKWDLIVRSTMTRAQETAKIMQKHIPGDIPVRDCQMLEEGAPIPPEPAHGQWKPEPKFFQDGARIEAAFRKYFYRAPPEQEKDSYTVLVCHANVIRYFVCKALQFPPEGWLRISLNHASITYITVHPNGDVVLRGLGDTGFMDPEAITSRNTTSRSRKG